MANWVKVTPNNGAANVIINMDHVKMVVGGDNFTRLVFGFDNKEILNVAEPFEELSKLAGPSKAAGKAPAKKAAKKAAAK